MQVFSFAYLCETPGALCVLRFSTQRAAEAFAKVRQVHTFTLLPENETISPWSCSNAKQGMRWRLKDRLSLKGNVDCRYCFEADDKEDGNMLKNGLIGIAICSLAFIGGSCQNAADTTANTNANATQTSTTSGPDNSEITTTTENGVKTETRTFKDNGRVSKVVATTTKDGNRAVKVYSKSGEEREMKSEPEKAMSASGDAIADAAGFTKDKTVDVADKSKDIGVKVGDKTKDGAVAVKDKTVDLSLAVADKSKAGAKTVADKTATGAKKAVKAVKKIVP